MKNIYLTYQPGDFFISGRGKSQERIVLKEKINDETWVVEINKSRLQKYNVTSLKPPGGKRMTLNDLLK